MAQPQSWQLLGKSLERRACLKAHERCARTEMALEAEREMLACVNASDVKALAGLNSLLVAVRGAEQQQDASSGWYLDSPRREPEQRRAATPRSAGRNAGSPLQRRRSALSGLRACPNSRWPGVQTPRWTASSTLSRNPRQGGPNEARDLAYGQHRVIFPAIGEQQGEVAVTWIV